MLEPNQNRAVLLTPKQKASNPSQEAQTLKTGMEKGQTDLQWPVPHAVNLEKERTSPSTVDQTVGQIPI